MRRLLTKILSVLIITLLPFALTSAQDSALKSLQFINKSAQSVTYGLSDMSGRYVFVVKVASKQQFDVPSRIRDNIQKQFVQIIIWHHPGKTHDCGTAALVGNGQIVAGNDRNDVSGLSCQVVVTPAK